VAQLAELSFEVHDKPGRLNQNADVLSRLPVHSEPKAEDLGKDFLVIKEEEVRASLWPVCKDQTNAYQAAQTAGRSHMGGHSWEELQQPVSQVSPVLTALRSANRPNKVQMRVMSLLQWKLIGQWDRLNLQQGVICYEEVRQLIVPETLRRYVYETMHDHGQ